MSRAALVSRFTRFLLVLSCCFSFVRVCVDSCSLKAHFSLLVDNCSKADHDQLAKETLPMHPRQFHRGAQCNNRENLNQPRKFDVQNLKVRLCPALMTAGCAWRNY